MNDKIALIRSESNPQADCNTAVEAHAKMMDALYRLSFTADKLTAKEVDMLVNIVSKTDVILVLLTRIRHVKEKGFQYTKV